MERQECKALTAINLCVTVILEAVDVDHHHSHSVMSARRLETTGWDGVGVRVQEEPTQSRDLSWPRRVLCSVSVGLLLRSC